MFGRQRVRMKAALKTTIRRVALIAGPVLSTIMLHLSRNCAAPLTAYYAQKENDYGNER